MDQVKRIMKDNTDLFSQEGGLKARNSSDTIAYFIQKENYLWILLRANSNLLAFRSICCKQIAPTRYSIVKSELGPEIFGECPFIWENYLQHAGPYIILELLANGSGYCGNFPRIFKLDGTELNTGGLSFTYWGCDEAIENSECRRTDVSFQFKDHYLQAYHAVEVMKEDDRVVHHRYTYSVRYFFDGLNILSKDTVGLKGVVYLD